MMNKKLTKKRVGALAALMLLLSLSVSSTLAYFTDEGHSRNVITTGVIDVDVVEDFPDEGVTVMPGTSVKKTAWAELKQGSSTAYIRMTVKLSAHGVPATEELREVISFSVDSSKWTEKDGWWYYYAPVNAGEDAPGKTAPLFESLTFSGKNMGNQYQSTTIIVDVVAQAVQVKNNPGKTALTAQGWPAE